MIELLARLLDVKPLNLSEPTETAVDGRHAWQYNFSISDQYIKDLTVVWPSPKSTVKDIRLSGPATDEAAVSLNDWAGGSGFPQLGIMQLRVIRCYGSIQRARKRAIM